MACVACTLDLMYVMHERFDLEQLEALVALAAKADSRKQFDKPYPCKLPSECGRSFDSLEECRQHEAEEWE